MQEFSREPAASSGSLAWLRLGAGFEARGALERTLLTIDRARAQMLAYARRSELLSWPVARPQADELLLAPPNLRVPDPSFVDELRCGNFGLAGELAELKGRSPFARAPVSGAWAHELHGFAWLRHLEAARAAYTERMARRLLKDWLQTGSRDKLYAWAPETTGRRLMSWLAHSQLLLDAADPKFYALVVRSLHRQANFLSAAWQNAPEGYAKLVALIGLVLADLCLQGRDRQLKRSQKLLGTQIARQILADGGHIGRNSQTLVEVVLDLLPVRQCVLVRGLTPAGPLLRALDAMLPMLRHLRLGDGSLGRFNGVGPTDREALATVLGYDRTETVLPALAAPSGYARLERGLTVVLVDVGQPPPLSVGQCAHAGCLSFEMSVGGEPIFVNNGAPASQDPARRAPARATASHKKLCLGEQSSSKLSRRAGRGGALPIELPDHVSARVAENAGGLRLEATHDGYVGRWGLLHTRSLVLDVTGARLEGSDALRSAKGVLRFAWDLPFAVHFHVHPEVEVWPGRDAHTADLVTKSGQHWRLSARGAALTIEDSVHNAGILGPRPAQQVVLRAACHGEAKLSWQLERLPPSSAPEWRRAEPIPPTPSLGGRLPLPHGQASALPAEPLAGRADRRPHGSSAWPEGQH
jgi:uncharacterized heparinase superfamily protein